jgi:hypothetical protein
MYEFHGRATAVGVALGLTAAVLATAAAGAANALDDEEEWTYAGGVVLPGVDLEGSSELTETTPEVQFVRGIHGVDSRRALELTEEMIRLEAVVNDLAKSFFQIRSPGPSCCMTMVPSRWNSGSP